METNNIEPRSTSFYLGTKTLALTYEEATRALIKDSLVAANIAIPIAIATAIAEVGYSRVETCLKDEFKKMAKTLSLSLAIITAIQTAITNGPALVNLLNMGVNDTLYVKIDYYEWLSGSGNHTAYYAETEYSIG